MLKVENKKNGVKIDAKGPKVRVTAADLASAISRRCFSLWGLPIPNYHYTELLVVYMFYCTLALSFIVIASKG
jgi:hypothetical protein